MQIALTTRKMFLQRAHAAQRSHCAHEFKVFGAAV